MRVAFFIAQFADVGGSQRYAFKLASSLPRSVSARMVFPSEGVGPEEARRAGLETVILEAPGELNRFGKVLACASLPRKLFLFLTKALPYSFRVASYLRRERVDVLHCTSFRGVMLAGLGGRLARVPVIWDLGGRFRVRGFLRFVPPLLATRIVLVADGLRGDVPGPFRRKCRTITKGFEPTPTEGAADRSRALQALVAAGRPVVACFSTITPFKGHHHLIEAARILRERSRRPPVFLVVAGVPETDLNRRYRRYLDDLVRRYSLEDFHFVGWQRDPWPYFLRADIVALPSVDRERLRLDGRDLEIEGHEGWGRVLSEAMYLGKPVVASDLVGVQEQIVDGETGLLVPPGDTGALADALGRLLDSGELRTAMGEKGKKRVREEFSMEREVKEVLGLWEEPAG